MPLIPAFQIQLKSSIRKGRVTVGKYDGKHPCLTAATDGGKVFIHSPHERSETGDASIRFLNINHSITSIASGPLDPELKSEHGERDVVLIGLKTNLLAYDVERNQDMFHKDVPDGVNAMIFAKIPGIGPPLAIVGGNCSIQGFDKSAAELFWTVTGDNVSALAFCDVHGKGTNELVVGSEDYEIRVFRQEERPGHAYWETAEVMSEMTETDSVIHLTPLRKGTFGYALKNGTIGVYEGHNRLWRVKSKNKVNSLAAYDLDADGVPELISGWSNGRFDVRNIKNGELIYRDNFSSPVASFQCCDYRLEGRPQLLCCSISGEIRGYLPANINAAHCGVLSNKADDKAMAELMQSKQDLMAQLRKLEDGARQNREESKKGSSPIRSATTVPADTTVDFRLQWNLKNCCLDAVLSTNNGSVIRAVTIFALDGNVFEQESVMAYPKKPSAELTIPIVPQKNIEAKLTLKVLVGARGSVRGSSQTYHVFEMSDRLPQFAMFMPMPNTAPGDKSTLAPGTTMGSLSFKLAEPSHRIKSWANSAFTKTSSNPAEKRHSPSNAARMGSLRLCYRSLRPPQAYLWVTRAEGSEQVVIQCSDMSLAASVFQSLCHFLGVKEKESTAEFVDELENFKKVLQQVDEFNTIRLQQTAEMADNSNLIKNLVIKAEDARILGDMTLMRKMYTELYTLNNELIGEYSKRSNNHQRLLGALRNVNQMIQLAASMRMGEAKSRVVTACRAAIKSNNVHFLFQIIRQGRVGMSSPTASKEVGKFTAKTQASNNLAMRAQQRT